RSRRHKRQIANMPAITNGAGIRRYSSERRIRSAADSSCVSDSHRAKKWRKWGEESIRYRLAQKLAQTQPGHAVLDIGGREGDIRKFLPQGIKYQGLDIAPEYAGPDVLIHDITKGLPFPNASFDRVFMIEVLEHTPTAFQTAGEVYRVLKPGGVWVVSVPNPYHFKEIIWNLFGVADKW